MKKLIAGVLFLCLLLGGLTGCSKKLDVSGGSDSSFESSSASSLPQISDDAASSTGSPASVPSSKDVILYGFEDGNAKIFTQQDLSAYGVAMAPITIVNSGCDTGKRMQVAIDRDASASANRLPRRSRRILPEIRLITAICVYGSATMRTRRRALA